MTLVACRLQTHLDIYETSGTKATDKHIIPGSGTQATHADIAGCLEHKYHAAGECSV